MKYGFAIAQADCFLLVFRAANTPVIHDAHLRCSFRTDTAEAGRVRPWMTYSCTEQESTDQTLVIGDN